MSVPRVRFAPSPTGDLHVGGVRSALFNWLHARHTGGVFVLRVEDTDRARSTDEATNIILEGMAWIGMEPDEGPFFQSRRGDLYRARVQELLAAGGAYRCWCTKETIAEKRTAAEKTGTLFRYDRICRGRTEGPSPDAPFVLRAALPEEGEVVIEDVVKGRVVIRNDHLDDFILARADGSPVYNFTVVVDDIDMGITHVIRGDDHLNNTPKQMHLYRLLGAEPPVFAHLPMVHGPDGKKLGKRHGAASILQFRELGFLPDVMRGFLARLGWSHGDQEEFTTDELIQLFDLTGVRGSAAVFDHTKLEWLNGRRIREMAPMELLDLAQPFLERAGIPTDAAWLPRAVVAVQERAKTLVEIAEKLTMFVDRGPVTFDEKAQTKFLTDDSKPRLAALADALAAVETFTAPEVEAATSRFLEERELKMKHIGQPTRVALTGGTVSPSIYDVMEIFGREVTLDRLRSAAGD